MELTDWLYYVVLPLVTIVALLLQKYFSRDQQVLRAIETMNTSSIKHVKKGERVKIKGRIKAQNDLITAPVSGRACLGYQLQVFRVASGSYSDVEAEMIHEAKSVIFYLEDKQGLAKILPRWQEITLHKEMVEELGRFDEPSERQAKVLEKYGEKATTGLGLTRRLVFKEGILEVGEQVAVVGEASWYTPMDGSDPFLVMTGTPEEPMLITDQLEITL